MAIKPLHCICLLIFFVTACSVNVESYDVVDIAFRQGDEQAIVLYTQSLDEKYCRRGGHSCTYTPLQQDLYQVTLPINSGSISATQLAEMRTLIRSGTNQSDYFYYSGNGHYVFGNTQSERLEICEVDLDAASGCAPLEGLQSNSADRSRVVLSDSSDMFIWQDSGYAPPFNTSSVQLSEQAGYAAYLEYIEEVLVTDRNTASIKRFLFDDRYLVAKANFTQGDNAVLAVIYSLEDDSFFSVEQSFNKPEQSVEVLAVQYVDNHFMFYLHFFDFEDGTYTKVIDDYFIFSTNDNVLHEVSDSRYKPNDDIWDVVNQQFIKINGAADSGLRMTTVPYQ